MRRREFIAGFGCTAVATSQAALAQTRAMPVIGFLASETPQLFADRLEAFRQGLSETGYVEGRNVAIEYRWAEGRYDRLPMLATELVERKVAVIVSSGGSPPALAAKAATKTIPVVFNGGFDPVRIGLVSSLNRPDGNVTGVTTLNTQVGPKSLEFVHELLPTAKSFACLVNPTNSISVGPTLANLQVAARTLGLRLDVLQAHTERELDAVFTGFRQLGAAALVVPADAFFLSRSEQLAKLALLHGVAAIMSTREFPAAGGLMSYGGSLADSHRVLGDYAGRILGGAKPADLPVQQATRIKLVVNLKTAKALQLEVPTILLVRADEVIE